MAKIIPREIEFAVVSSGGVATTKLLEFLARRHVVNAPSDEDSIKHMPLPCVSFRPGFRYVFIFGDPVPATVSLFRRGYHALQSRKLQRTWETPQPIPLEMTLEEYAAGGRDLLGFEDHFLNYAERHLLYPTLFLHYEALWENQDILREFLGLSAEEMKDFPPRRIRQSEGLEIDESVLEQLRVLYGPFRARLDRFPGATVLGENLKPSPSSLMLTKSFTTAVKNGILSRFRPAGAPYGA